MNAGCYQLKIKKAGWSVAAELKVSNIVQTGQRL
jgi:hypothetical protein